MTIDLDQLENNYHVIWIPDAAKDAEQLRQLDTPLAVGVWGIWNDPLESLEGFVFEKGAFTTDTAEQWVADLKKASLRIAKKLGFSIDNTSLSDIQALLYQVQYETFELEDGQTIDWPWLQATFTTFVIVLDGGKLWKIPFTLSEENDITWGEPEMVKMVFLPLSKKAKPMTARALRFAFAPLSAKLDTDEDGLIWKEIFKVGTIFDSEDVSWEIEQWMIDGAYQAWLDGAITAIPVTAKDHFNQDAGLVPAEETIGTIQKMVKQGGSLYAGLFIQDDDIREKLDDGLISGCSVYIWFDYVNTKTGKSWDATIVHLLLTNYPRISDLADYGEQPQSLAASLGGQQYIIYYQKKNEEVSMPPQTQDPPAFSLEEGQLGKALAAQGYTIQDITAFKAQQLALKTKTRKLEITQVIAALEGKGEHAQVTQIAGFVHTPAVINAVTAALQSAPETLGLDIGESGSTGFDELILNVVNAVPEAGRISLEQPATPPRQPPSDGKKKKPFANVPMPEGHVPTEEQVAAFDEGHS